MKFVSIKLCAAIALGLIGMSLGGCASGSFNGHSSDAMQMVVAWKNPDYGPMTDAEWAKVVRHSNWCKTEVADKQLSGPVESALTSGIAYGIGGALGVGGGAEAANIGGVGPMALYGGIAGAGNGIVSGLQSHSNAKSAVVGYCTTQNLGDAKTREPGVHAMGSYVRTKNRSDRIPSFVVPAGTQPATNGVREDNDSPPPPHP